MKANLVSDLAALYVEDFLPMGSCKLRLLDLSHNRISDRGGVAIAKGLKRNKTMEEVRLDGNNITDATAQVLIDALEERKGVLKVHASDTFMKHRWKLVIDDRISRH